MIAFLGTGLLGRGFVRALLRRGEDVHVYNRTIAKARELEADGARVFASPEEAVRGATRIHLSLADDAAVDEVLARASVAAGTRIVDHTTTSTAGAARRAARFAEAGVPFVHAPVFMGPKNALDGTGLMLVSGPRERVLPLKPDLAAMTGKLVDLGDRPDKAAAFKLLSNLFLMFVTSGLADVFALARAMGIAPEDAATLFTHFNPGATVDARIGRMLSKEWDNVSWELRMARKDARLMVEEGAAFAVLPAIAAHMDALIARGHGDADWTVLARDALS